MTKKYTASPKSGRHAKEESPKPRRGRPPKQKGMPNRPLSAYNAFFRQARNEILASIESGDLPNDYKVNAEASLKQFKGSQGPARFQAIARTISSRWKALSDSERAPFDEVARQEMEAYKVKKAEFLRKQELAASTSLRVSRPAELAAENDRSSSTETKAPRTIKIPVTSPAARILYNIPGAQLQQSLHPATALMSDQLLIHRYRTLLHLERLALEQSLLSYRAATAPKSVLSAPWGLGVIGLPDSPRPDPQS